MIIVLVWCPGFGQDRVNFHQNPGREKAGRADPTWPNRRGYSIPCAVMLGSDRGELGAGTHPLLGSMRRRWLVRAALWVVRFVTESQNHRIVGVGRDLCASSSPTPLLKQGHLQQAAQNLVQAGLEYLQRRRLHNLPGQPVPVLRHPQREEVLPHVQTELPVPQFGPIAPCPVTGHH